jgi:hypothetical protein
VNVQVGDEPSEDATVHVPDMSAPKEQTIPEAINIKDKSVLPIIGTSQLIALILA